MPEPRLNSAASASPRTDLAAAWRDAAKAGRRYYGRLGGLAVALAEELVIALGKLPASARPSPEPPQASGPESPLAAAEPAAQTIVIEAAAGKRGLGVFMVENTTGRKVSAPVGVSAFADPDGREVRPAVTFSPDVVSLEPGDQVLVQVAAAVDDTFEPGVRYRAEIGIPRLSGTKIPIVVRRRPSKARRAAKTRAKTTP